MTDRATPLSLRIASYNIRKAKGLDRRRDPGRILAVLNGLEADVVALQEADLRLGRRRSALPRDLIAGYTDFQVVPLARNDVSLGWHGNAILLRRGLSVSRKGWIDLPGLEPRGAVWVDLDLSSPVRVVAAHLGLVRRHRQGQLQALAESLDDAEHAVIAGDFNEWSLRRGLDPLTERFSIHAPGPSFHTRRPVAALDRIALSHGLDLHGTGVEQGALARRASDHLPIWADIAMPPAIEDHFENRTGTFA